MSKRRHKARPTGVALQLQLQWLGRARARTTKNTGILKSGAPKVIARMFGSLTRGFVAVAVALLLVLCCCCVVLCRPLLCVIGFALLVASSHTLEKYQQSMGPDNTSSCL